jgi:hypothetical protein
VPRKALQTDRPQQEHARKFVDALSCSSRRELVTTVHVAQAIFWAHTAENSDARAPARRPAVPMPKLLQSETVVCRQFRADENAMNPPIASSAFKH